MIETWIAVAAGGAGGAVLRAGLVRFVWQRRRQSAGDELAPDPAIGILLANTLGCAFLGIWLGQDDAHLIAWPFWVHALVMTGACGGLTTFSTLCSDALRLARERSALLSAGYLLATAALGTAAFQLGTLLLTWPRSLT